MKKRQIILVPGILTKKSIILKWQCWLSELFPEDEIKVIGEYYTYLEIDKMKKLKEELLNLIDNNKETILIGHSFGGIIINSALNQSKKNKVKKVISIFAPNQMNLFGMKKRKEFLGYSSKLNSNIKTKSYGAYFDYVVPFFWTKINNETHENLFTDHYVQLFYSKKFFNKLIKKGVEDDN